MRDLKIYVLLLSLLLIGGTMSGQVSLSTISNDSLASKPKLSAAFTTTDFFPGKSSAALFDFKTMRPNSFFPEHKVTGIFCRMEHRIEATSNFAPRFRLGSVNYTDWMEGKKSLLSRYAK